MELNLISFIVFSQTTLTITSNFVYSSALNYDKEVIEANPTGNRNITEVKETDFEEQNDNSMQVKFPKHDEIVTSDRKNTDEMPGVPLLIPSQLPEVDPCIRSTCGDNYWHWCEEFNGTARCACLQDYFRSPPICIPECTSDSECNADLWCRNSRCIDPCPGYCGYNTQCHGINHRPDCSCLPGLTGNPLYRCYVVKPTACSPSPCGPNSQCREVEDQAVCRCQKHFMGRPPNCGLECTNNTECASDKACHNRKCVVDPCVNQCAGNGNCRVIAHNGEPLPTSIPMQRPEVDPCTPSPCGPNSQCQEYKGNACCTCLPNYISSPPTCRQECTVNSECNPYMACINNRCSDPCLGVCGNDAVCFIDNHVPYCKCPSCYFGDPFISCYSIFEEPNETSSGFLEWKKQTGSNFDFSYCYGSVILDAFSIRKCPPGTERFNGICVEIDD